VSARSRFGSLLVVAALCGCEDDAGKKAALAPASRSQAI